jgi:HAD superfamily hydrolase (TIGR01450 family)
VHPDLASYDTVVSDLDGTLWIDDNPLPGAVDLLDSFRRRGIRICLATNASVATSAQLRARLARAHLAGPDDILVTAADALGAQARERGIHEAAVIGAAGLFDALDRHGIRAVPADQVWQSWSAKVPGRAVAMGLAPDTDIRTLGRVATLLERGLPLLVTTAEVAYPTREGLSGGTGMALAALTARIAVDPIICGKPSLTFVTALRAHVVGRVLVIGDTVAADVELAAAAGWDSLLVLTGTSADQQTDWPRATFVTTDLMTIDAR